MLRKARLALVALTIVLTTAIGAHASEYTIKGVLANVDTINNTVTVKYKNGTEEILKVDEKSRITHNWQRRKVIPFKDLKVGSRVKARFKETHVGDTELKIITHMRVR